MIYGTNEPKKDWWWLRSLRISLNIRHFSAQPFQHCNIKQRYCSSEIQPVLDYVSISTLLAAR